MIEVSYIVDGKFIIVEANKIAIKSSMVSIWTFSANVVHVEHDAIVSIIGASGKTYILENILTKIKEEEIQN